MTLFYAILIGFAILSFIASVLVVAACARSSQLSEAEAEDCEEI